MFKQIIVTAALAASVSVPLAGSAWADQPSEPGATDNAVGAGGVPQKLGDFANENGANPSGDPITPGSVFSGVAKVPHVNTPDAYGNLIDATIAPLLGVSPFGPTPPGLGTKTFTPGCSAGVTAGGHRICS
jgi:hypothetical protein